MTCAYSEASLLSGEEGGQDAPRGEGLEARWPRRRHWGACRAAAAGAAAAGAVGAALRWGGLGDRVGSEVLSAREGGPAGAAPGSLLGGWDTQVRPKIHWDSESDFDPQGLFDELARNEGIVGEPRSSRPRRRRSTPARADAAPAVVDERVASTVLGAPAPPGGPAVLWPRQNKTLLLIGQDNDNIEGYVDAFGTPPGFSVYVIIDDVQSGIWGPGNWGAGMLCAECLLQKHGQGVAFNLAVDIVDKIDDVVAGVWDDNIRSIAAWVKTTGGPVYMRPGYEFDGSWNHFEPTAYRLAYRRFVDLFRGDNVTNVLWVWHSAVCRQNYGGHDRMAWYPGDGYVDLFGASVFTAPYPHGHPYKSHTPQNLQDVKDWYDVAAAKDKPLAIVESTARGYDMALMESASAWKSWFQPMLEFIEQNDVRLFAYINCDWDIQPMWKGGSWGDTRLQANTILSQLWTDEMGNARWHDALGEPRTD
ncbi:unnamed protein product [Prorocentrum cordatum]|uniref:GH26 domain-containing protein n=1 Tax=Prorocentrum cordatum TaxID=2364126 RepID=A0ABN9UQ54_9DINO|nr:unnamed protein product [Polarella glacialis]